MTSSGPPAETPEGELGFSILRTDKVSEDLRRRLELPARIGRYVLIGLGAMTLGAGTGLWLGHVTPVAEGLLVFGFLLVLLAAVEHRLLLRDRAHWPQQAHLWNEGIELVLSNGEIRAAPWNDPKFALDLYVRPMRGGSEDEVLVNWKLDPKIPLYPITQEGFDRVREAALSHGLECAEYRAGDRRHSLRGFEIRVPGRLSAPASLPAESQRSSL